VEKCNLIHKSKLPEVEQLIYYLQNRRKEAQNAIPKERPQTAFATEMLNASNLPSPDEIAEVACMTKVEEYVDLLYENIPEKVMNENFKFSEKISKKKNLYTDQRFRSNSTTGKESSKFARTFFKWFVFFPGFYISLTCHYFFRESLGSTCESAT